MSNNCHDITAVAEVALGLIQSCDANSALPHATWIGSADVTHDEGHQITSPRQQGRTLTNY